MIGYMDFAILEEFGLTKTEIKTYLTLLELGASTAGLILAKSKLPNSTVHRDLNALIELGLVRYILEGKRKIYQGADPEYFLNLMSERKRKFEEALPQLKKLQKKSTKKELASVYRGIKGIKEVYSIMINAEGKEYNTFGGGSITTQVMGATWWLNLHKRRVANRLPSRQVFDETVRDAGENIIKNPITKIRYVDKEFAQFQETVIVGNLVAIAVFSENPYAFLIEDVHVAKSYRKHFKLLWKNATK